MLETDSGAHIETTVVHNRKMAVKAGFITAVQAMKVIFPTNSNVFCIALFKT